MINNIFKKIWFIIAATFLVFVSINSIKINATEQEYWFSSDGYEYYYYNSQKTLNTSIVVDINDPEAYVIEYAVDTTLQLPFAAEFYEVFVENDSFLRIKGYEQDNMYYQTLSLVTSSTTTVIAYTNSANSIGDWYFNIRKKPNENENLHLPGPNEHSGWYKIEDYHYYFYNSRKSYDENDPIIINVNPTTIYDVEYALDNTFVGSEHIPEFYTLNIPSNSYLKIEVLFDYDKFDELGIGMYYQVLKLVTPNGINIIDTTESSGFEDGWFFRVRQKIKEAPEIPDDVITTPIDQLPLTGSGEIGTVNFSVNGYNVIVQIIYKQIYFLKYSFTADTSMQLFDFTEAYYINVDNNPSIFINNSNYLNLLDIVSAPEDEKPTFVPHSVWDLKTNKIKTIDQYIVYAYMKQMQTGPIVAYVYTDEFIIDKLLSIQVSWTSRQENGFPVKLWRKYTDWEQTIETYTGDEYLEYRDLSTDWQHWIPVWQFLKLGQQLNTYYQMPRIQAVDWNNIQPEYNITKTELETYFHKIDNNFNTLKNNPRYKVWAVALQGGKTSSSGFAKTEFYHNEDDLTDERNLHIMHMTYETNGVLYETIGDHINLKIAVHEGLLPDGPRNYWAIIAFLVAAIILFAAFKARAFSSPRKAIEFIIGTAIVLAFIIIGYQLLKDGNFLEAKAMIGP